MNFYISDLHLNDKRVFKLCGRPFNSLKEMEDFIIKRWNEKVSDNDDVYILGDLSDNSIKAIEQFLLKVKGKKHLIIGNHDVKYLKEEHLEQLFVDINGLLHLKDKGRKVCVCHYPLLDWLSGKEITYHIYGHIHNKTAANGKMYEDIKIYYSDKPAFNASVDVIGFEPVTLDELIKLKEENSNDSYIN